MSTGLTMGEITSVAKNSKGFASLRTTIPISMVRQWELKPKDRLYWKWEVRNGEMVAVVVKYDSKKQQLETRARRNDHSSRYFR